MPSVFDRARQGFVSDEELALQTLFPAKNKFQMLQMLGECSPKSKVLWNLAGLFRRRFGSQVLTIFQEEDGYNSIKQDRKGRLEATEIVARPRLKDGKED